MLTLQNPCKSLLYNFVCIKMSTSCACHYCDPWNMSKLCQIKFDTNLIYQIFVKNNCVSNWSINYFKTMSKNLIYQNYAQCCPWNIKIVFKKIWHKFDMSKILYPNVIQELCQKNDTNLIHPIYVKSMSNERLNSYPFYVTQFWHTLSRKVHGHFSNFPWNVL